MSAAAAMYQQQATGMGVDYNNMVNANNNNPVPQEFANQANLTSTYQDQSNNGVQQSQQPQQQQQPPPPASNFDANNTAQYPVYSRWF